MGKAKTALIKYIFLDIISFTNNRSVEAQADLIGYLNSVVNETLEKHNLATDQDILPESHGKSILIPTGDGICIALIDVGDEYDIHLRVALDILALIDKHNSETPDDMRKFEVRIGLNENVDNLVTDINGNQNVAGMGINMAQRTMSQADGSQILVGQATHETLFAREQYMESFRRYKAKAKHGIEFDVYQYIDEDKTGLNIKTPEVFFLPRPVVKGPLKLTKSAAYYLAHAIKNENFFISKKGVYPNSATIILLHFLARDSAEKSNAGKYREPVFETWKANSAPIEVQWDYYSKVDNWVAIGFSDRIQADLVEYADCFEFSLVMYTFVSEKGQKKLRYEWPEIWQEFSLDELG